MVQDVIHLFLGKDKHIIKTKMKRLIDEITDEEDCITSYDLDYVNVSSAISDATTIPFLHKIKVIILKNPKFLTSEKTDISHDLDAFVRYLKRPSETTYLIIDGSGLEMDLKNETYRQVRNYAVINESKELTEIEVKGWIRRQFDLEKVEIDDDALHKIYDYTGNDLTRARNEIDKLLSYANECKTVSMNDVKLLLSKNFENEIFDLIGLLLKKDQERVLSIYFELTKGIQDPMGIISMISKNLRDMLMAGKLVQNGYNQGDISTIMNISPGRAYYLMKDVKTHPLKEIERLVKKFADLDFKIKSGKIDKGIGIEFILLGK